MSSQLPQGGTATGFLRTMLSQSRQGRAGPSLFRTTPLNEARNM